MTRRAGAAGLLLAWLLAAPAQAQEDYGAGISVEVGAPAMTHCRVSRVTAYSVEAFPGTTASGLPTRGHAGQLVAHGRNGQEGLPFGTQVWVEGIGVLTVADRGGGLVGDWFDVLMQTQAEARAWGSQWRQICVVTR